MSTNSRLASALLITTALTLPSLAHAQDNTEANAPLPDLLDDASEQAQSEPEDVEVSIPGGGGEIIVTGRRERNLERSSAQVVSLLSTAEIARTGEGNIAGALARVTGLSVVGSGYVYVRGLGDRYSLALLNGSPLPSPEPLKRVVPLDLFPTGVIASSLVQKSYSVNYPGEFGGGVINLTTKATPRDPFLNIGFGISGDTETTGNLSYTYYGSKTDWTGYDNGNRDIPPALQAFFNSGERLSSGNVDSTAIARELVTGRNGVVQRDTNTRPNFSGSLSAGKTFQVGSSELGIIAAAGYSNKMLTRAPLQQISLSADLSTIESSFRQVNTDERSVVNGLLGLGLESGSNKLRWTTIYIHDTIKQSRLSLGNRQQTSVDFLQQKTAFYERQLFDTQVAGEFKLNPDLNLDVRAGYANSQRKAPFELGFEYVRTNSSADPFGQYFVNRLNNGNGGDAGITFSRLNEDLISGGLDLTYRLSSAISATIGGAYSDTHRTSSRRDFLILAPSSFQGSSSVISAIGLLRPDLLLSPNLVDAFGIELIETDEGNPAFVADLTNFAGYGKVNASIGRISIDIGVRYEDAAQSVAPIQVFNIPGSATTRSELKNSYWLPAATLTYEVASQMQLRLSGSKTIARPQFRELINQPYFDPDTNRPYRGNPLLVDSQLYNGEIRFEYYFAPEQRFSLSGFYKKLDKPIEAFVTGVDLETSYANAPEAQLYGAEVDVQKYFDLSGIGGDFFAVRRFVAAGNYTFTKSKLKVGANDSVSVFGAASTIANDYFRDGAPLTGQSDHIVNLQLGLENQDRLSQQTFLLSYASDRVVSRGLNGSPPQPDVIESPGFQLDFVWREGLKVLGTEFEIKLEARNILERGHEEFQKSGSNRIDINSYDLGTSFALSVSAKL